MTMLASASQIDKAALIGGDSAAKVARLVKLEKYLARVFAKAVGDARGLIPTSELERMIIEARSFSLPSFGKVATTIDELPRIGWNESLSLDLFLLGRPYKIVHVDIARFDDLWRKSGAFYTARAGSDVTDGVARIMRRGVMLAPPSIARIGDQWAFLDGRVRYLYARESGEKSLPLAVPVDDASSLQHTAGSALSPAVTGGGGTRPPAIGAASRPYAGIFDAVDHLAHFLANQFATAVMAACLAVGQQEALAVARMLDGRSRRATRKLNTSLDFETPNSRALSEMRLSLLNLVREVSDDQRQVLLNILRGGVEKGINPVQIAREMRAGLGLTAKQMEFVDNYRRALGEVQAGIGDRAKIMARALRDKRFDPSVLRAIRQGGGLDQAKIDAMVARYQERFIAYRAETIARTEALAAAHMGEAAVWEQAVADGHIVAEEVIQTWHSAHDARVRMTHRFLSGQKRVMGQKFQSVSGAQLRFPGDPQAPARERCNCRCILTRQITERPLLPGETALTAGGAEAVLPPLNIADAVASETASASTAEATSAADAASVDEVIGTSEAAAAETAIGEAIAEQLTQGQVAEVISEVAATASAVVDESVLTFDELKALAAKWARSDLSSAAANPEAAASLEAEVASDWRKAQRYLNRTSTATDDPNNPKLGRPWSGTIQAAYQEIKEEIDIRSQRSAWNTRYLAAKDKLNQSSAVEAPTQAQLMFQASWSGTRNTFTTILTEDFPKGAARFSGDALTAFTAMEKDVRAVVAAIDAGNEAKAQRSLLAALTHSRELDALHPGPEAGLYTQYIRSAARIQGMMTSETKQ